METKTVQERIAELAVTAHAIEIEKEIEADNAILLLTLVDGEQCGNIKGSANNLANMLYSTAKEYPQFADMVKYVA